MINEYKKLKWFFLWALLLAGGLVASNLTGYRMMAFGSQQKWTAGGPGIYHK